MGTIRHPTQKLYVKEGLKSLITNRSNDGEKILHIYLIFPKFF